jgi:ribosomal protein S18 acetylase RimI-like enzyme
MEQRRENKNGRLDFIHLHWPREERFFQNGEKIFSVRKCDIPTFIYLKEEAYVTPLYQLLLIDNILVAETKFNIETEDEFFNEKYLSIYELETFEQYRGKGYAKLLLEGIFNYVKNTLKLNIITLIVDKDNHKAVNLYSNNGFEIFMEYEDSYS